MPGNSYRTAMTAWFRGPDKFAPGSHAHFRHANRNAEVAPDRDSEALDALKIAATRCSVRVVGAEWRGTRVWIKKATPNKAKLWHALQFAVAAVIPWPILRPTVSSGGRRGMLREIERLRSLRDAGFKVPEVVALSDDWVALSHLGEVVDVELKRNTALSPEMLRLTIGACARTLAELHHAGFAHGSGRLKDFVRTEAGAVGFIDFEEDIDGRPRAALQARELWMFCMGVARYLHLDRSIVQHAVNTYRAGNPSADVMTELRKLLGLVAPLARFLALFERLFSGHMARCYAATRCLIAMHASPMSPVDALASSPVPRIQVVATSLRRKPLDHASGRCEPN